MTLLSHALARGTPPGTLRRGNNFDLVRLLAAVAVVYCHSFLMQPGDSATDPATATLGFDSFGALGVYAFFLMSGMLVTASFVRQRSILRFVALRVARIWPAVAVGSLVVVLVLGPLFTTLPLSTYFGSRATWINLDNFRTIVLKEGWVLPGVFEHNRFAHDICAPLWTLPIEVRCYLIVLVTGTLGLLTSRRGTLVALAIGLLGFVLRIHVHPFHIGMRDFSVKAGGYSFWPELFFMFGMLLYAWRAAVRLDGRVALGLVALYLALHHSEAAQPLFYLAFVYGVLWMATTPMLRRLVPRNDYSYGIYIYGFVVQQCVANLAPHLDHLTAVLIAAPFILVCAALSWHGVERPALRWVRARTERAVRRRAVLESMTGEGEAEELTAWGEAGELPDDAAPGMVGDAPAR
ncbi:acyltransferase family protein [Paraburkholderia kururiensis]|uniref:acyltransferase family protein n=1 Tax=Paraburkholderia kururiensis TaxID=984307 RepID=UPI0018F7AA89|nr:acyltransferase [Paraburkholderia kururiensis]